LDCIFYSVYGWGTCISKLFKINKRFYCFASLVSLLSGIGVYLFFRNSNILLFELIPKLSYLNDVYIPIKKSFISSLFLFNLPDVLWFLSGIFFIRYFWFGNEKWQMVYLVCFYIIAVVIETSQIIENIPGTFDVLDMLFICITAFVEGFLYRKILIRNLR